MLELGDKAFYSGYCNYTQWYKGKYAFIEQAAGKSQKRNCKTTKWKFYTWKIQYVKEYDETGELQVQGQPKQLKEALSQNF